MICTQQINQIKYCGKDIIVIEIGLPNKILAGLNSLVSFPFLNVHLSRLERYLSFLQ